jgi:hypothetical protein
VEACITKPGLIAGPNRTTFAGGIFKAVMRTLVCVPKVEATEITATMVDQVVNGFEKETLLNEDLVRIGSEVLQRQEAAS